MKKIVSIIMIMLYICSMISISFASNSTYIVKKDDVIWKIAKENGLTTDQLINLNPQIKNPNLIHIGDIIYLNKFSNQNTNIESQKNIFNYISHGQDTIDEYDDGIIIAKRELDVEKDLYVEVLQEDKAEFPNGMYTGYGSAMTLKSISKDVLEFYVLTDRGPNGDGPTYVDGNGKETPAKLFPQPNFTPQIGISTVTMETAVVKEAIDIKAINGQPISGLPLPSTSLGSTKEVPLKPNLDVMSTDENGLDPEGIAVDKDGYFWICDEYGPFVLKLDPNGKIMKRYEAGNGLPEMAKYRHPNRGMEGLTIAPNGMIYTSIQSTLNINDKATRNIAQFTRIIEINPDTDEVRTLAYPIDVASYGGKNKNCKIGDVFAISNDKLLVIEQGNTSDGKMNKIFLADISKATDITNMKYAGKELEYVEDISVLTNISFITKEEIMDLRDYGWTPSKAEGLVLMPDHQTIVVINDNDFGMSTKTVNEKGEEVDIEDYTLSADGKFTNEDGKVEKLTITTIPTTEKLNMWFIKLTKPLI